MKNFTENVNARPIRSCLCCGNEDLHFSLDLSKQPLANSYLRKQDQEEENYPLGINFCPVCTHIQLTYAINPDKLFRDYLYVSGTTDTAKDYFKWFVEFTQGFTKGKNVLDIACNDGSQLDPYKEKGYNTYGIDPAVNLFEKSSKNHSIVCDYLTKESISKFPISFDIIIAQNVFAHNTYPYEFLRICKEKLNKGGYIFIQTSQADMIRNNEFDTIYHEHISFFSVKSFAYLAKRAGLNLVKVRRSDIHGTSFIFVLSEQGSDNSKQYISMEKEINLEVIDNYSKNCHRIARETYEEVTRIRQEGYKVIGYGAAAKGNTFINFTGLKLDYIVDDNALKHNLYAPGSRIPIKHPDSLIHEQSKICVIPLSWNFFSEIKRKVAKRGLNNVIFLSYFPELSISKG